MKHSLEELERLAGEATPGPWEIAPNEPNKVRVAHSNLRGVAGLSVGHGSTDANAAFIAASREAMPELIQRLREAEARCAVLLERAALAEGVIAGMEKRHE